MERTKRQGRISKQLLYGLKEERRYWNLKEEALDCTVWRNRFGRGCGPVARETMQRMRFVCARCDVLSGVSKDSSRLYHLPSAPGILLGSKVFGYTHIHTSKFLRGLIRRGAIYYLSYFERYNSHFERKSLRK